ncbi:small subunit processome, U3 snoRNP-associated protein Nop58 [Schizosaccharomyces pombe]|uniref:Nucleolar protein 58 n=1 Tax=Schizosaccharomyces pombe (strain 972 / ATCC 24843) TaxID=284812 RepID=NOP58_SCHPO|nr:putative U3 snoRNP protein Nop58 [Schizosaccharomyces pombe]Q9P7S7.1 RecName: Full=Nucleolar protein 58 [Schizosaccharomyces pombe 972h-]CAB72231.1 U3 snoRNP protein Nop58 (predicted) [Schizosaccharomyces pombe]|eukprot:NP_593106.1 putative U3 snoRNP protein Nop58 [Schizosaccharomyces pombe]
MFILTETAAGYAIFKAKDKLLKKRDALIEDLKSPEGASNLLKLQSFAKFESTVDALDNVSALVEGKVSSKLSSLLEGLSDSKSSTLVVADPKLGNAINKLPGLEFEIISDSSVQDLYRGIREHLSSLISGLAPSDLNAMSLGLSHSLSRHKLKFSPDKVDTMIVQAIALLDDLDKELNTYAMRVREWYGWHFPEMGKIIQDNLAYARVIKAMGMRTKCSETDFSDILPEEIEATLKSAAEISMGTEITEEDLDNIVMLADQVLELASYRAQLSEYLRNRMQAIAPNLTALVGELVGARLIAHAGSLMNLAKQPASTIQILGAEKALFRALKTKHSTPKYGLIYHASLVGQANSKNKGKIARVLATKAALSLRVDALSDKDTTNGNIGLENRIRVENRLRSLEGGKLLPLPTAPVQQSKVQINGTSAYSTATDAVTKDAEESQEDVEMDIVIEKKKKKSSKLKEADGESSKKEKKEKKDKKHKKSKRKSEESEDGESPKKKKKSKKSKD